MEIRLAMPEEFIEIMYLTRVCSIELSSIGCLFWNYFDKQINELIENKQVFVIREYECVVGILVLNQLINEEYKKINWTYADNNALYINLLVHPNWRKHSMCDQLFAFIERYAVKNNFYTLRIDTYEKNLIALEALELMQYKKAGEFFLPFHSTPFYCFEKKLTASVLEIESNTTSKN